MHPDPASKWTMIGLASEKGLSVVDWFIAMPRGPLLCFFHAYMQSHIKVMIINSAPLDTHVTRRSEGEL